MVGGELSGREITGVPTVRAALGVAADSGWQVQVRTREQCPAVLVSVNSDGGGTGRNTACENSRGWLPRLHPDLVIVSDAETPR